MATGQDFQPTGSISFGRIFARAFGAIRANPVTILGLAFVFVALPGLLVAPLMQNYSRAIVTPEGQMIGASTGFMASGASGFGALLVWLLTYAIAQGAIVRATAAYGEGRTEAFGPAATAGLRVALPLIGLNILFGLAVGFASLFLLVPGIILAIMWAVALPARAVEPIGVIAAFGRSRTLTRGARWTIFGFAVVLVLILLALGMVVGIGAIATGGLPDAAAAPAFPIGTTILNAITSTLSTAIVAALHASLYVELREWKEGPQSARMAEIFA